MDWTKKLFQENAREANAASQVSEVSTEHHKDLAAQRSMTLDKSGFHNGVGGARGKALSCIGRRHKRQVPSLGWEDPWRRAWQPTSVFFTEESHAKSRKQLKQLRTQVCKNYLNGDWKKMGGKEMEIKNFSIKKKKEIGWS